MPHDLATNPDATIFEYRGIISPPRDWDRWGELNRRLAAHLLERYGIDEVARWGFEIWNEANLEVFWTGTQAEYFRLYDVAARAIKSVDERLLVGGPSTAAAGWIGDFLDFVVGEGSPLDFLSTHTYGNLPLDVGRALAARGLDGVAVWWTEWGTTPTHFNPVSDSAWAATFVLHGMKSAQGRANALAYWVVSDHFEELGRPPALLHGGFGLLTVGNLRKPRWWALALAEELGDELVELDLRGDGAGSLVDGWAARRVNDGLDLLLWNGTLDQTKTAGDALLDRELRIAVSGLRQGAYNVSLARIDEEHSNLAGRRHGASGWPSPVEWEHLRSEDRLDEERLPTVKATAAGAIELTVRVPMPGVARLRFDMMPPGHLNRQLAREED
jgi:xylan 1,4-beta-xylosidase